MTRKEKKQEKREQEEELESENVDEKNETIVNSAKSGDIKGEEEKQEEVKMLECGEDQKVLEFYSKDELCAKYIKDSLEGKTSNFDEVKDYLKGYKSSKKFLGDNHSDQPKGDFYCAMELNKFKFIMKINRHNEHLSITKEQIKNPIYK